MLVTDVGGLAEIIPHEKVGYVTPIEPNLWRLLLTFTLIIEKKNLLLTQRRKKDLLGKVCASY